jgi:hypothetical protein
MGKRKRITFGKSKNVIVKKSKHEKTVEPTALKLVECKEYTGAQVNAANLGPLVKLTSKDENHHGFVFATGENRDTHVFCPYAICSAGGLYFCKMADAAMWFDYSHEYMHFIRPVTLPDDARVYIEKNKMKADKFILGEREEIFSNKPLFDYLLHHCEFFGSEGAHYTFEPSFYNEEAWKIILRKHCVDLGRIPDRLKTPVLQDLVLKTKELYRFDVKQIAYAIGYPVAFTTDSIIESLIARGLSYYNFQQEYDTRQMLRCFIRQRKIADVEKFPAGLFLDETLLDGLYVTRQLQQVVDKRKQEAKELDEKGVF